MIADQECSSIEARFGYNLNTAIIELDGATGILWEEWALRTCDLGKTFWA
jgi:hypothetical protein